MNTSRAIAEQLAGYFYHHLLAEMDKSLELIQKIRFDGRTAEDINKDLIYRMEYEFPGVQEKPNPAFNLFEEWVKRNKFIYDYKNFVFEAYNLIYFERLKAMKVPGEESRNRFIRETLRVFERFNYRQDGFSISFFIRVENNMRELMREITNEIEGIDRSEAWNVIFEQSKDYQEVVNEFFEKILTEEKERSDALLKNILPTEVAEELKKKQKVLPVHIEQATVLFSDFKGFTFISEKMAPTDLIFELDACFSLFDAIVEKYGLEKIKTIGDSYMCAGGLPLENKTHAIDVALAALEFLAVFNRIRQQRLLQDIPFWDIRIGFHTGPVVAGIIGKKKFSYDIWGDTVNTASRMESSGIPGKINLSQSSYDELKDLFDLKYRGSIATKGKGDLPMYFLEGILPDLSEDGKGKVPNRLFQEKYDLINQNVR